MRHGRMLRAGGIRGAIAGVVLVSRAAPFEGIVIVQRDDRIGEVHGPQDAGVLLLEPARHHGGKCGTAFDVRRNRLSKRIVY